MTPFARNKQYERYKAAPGEMGYAGTLEECENRSLAEPQSPGFAFSTSNDCIEPRLIVEWDVTRGGGVRCRLWECGSSDVPVARATGTEGSAWLSCEEG